MCSASEPWMPQKNPFICFTTAVNFAEPFGGNSLINLDFLPRPFFYLFVIITITRRRRASSVKAWCRPPSICSQRLRAFPPCRVSASESAYGLRLFKCSLPITSCLITYLLDLLSCIYSLKEKAKEKCRLSSSHRALKDLKEVKKTLFLINNFQMTAPIPVKKRNTWRHRGGCDKGI